MEKSIRSFIAIGLDRENQDRLANIQDKLKECGARVRWVKPGNIHLTLKFLGNISSTKVDKIINLLPELYNDTSPFDFTITHLGAFPKISRPNVIWAGVEHNADKLTALASTLEHAMVSLGFPKERKKFSPHITIGRVKQFKNLTPLSEGLQTLQIRPPLQQKSIIITLYESTLTGQGPVYTALKHLSL